MYVNLHTLPRGQHLFTVYLRWPEGMYEEIDVVASLGETYAETTVNVLRAVEPTLEDYVEGGEVVGIVDQNDGETIYDAR